MRCQQFGARGCSNVAIGLLVSTSSKRTIATCGLHGDQQSDAWWVFVPIDSLSPESLAEAEALAAERVAEADLITWRRAHA